SETPATSPTAAGTDHGTNPPTAPGTSQTHQWPEALEGGRADARDLQQLLDGRVGAALHDALGDDGADAWQGVELGERGRVERHARVARPRRRGAGHVHALAVVDRSGQAHQVAGGGGQEAAGGLYGVGHARAEGEL